MTQLLMLPKMPNLTYRHTMSCLISLKKLINKLPHSGKLFHSIRSVRLKIQHFIHITLLLYNFKAHWIYQFKNKRNVSDNIIHNTFFKLPEYSLFCIKTFKHFICYHTVSYLFCRCIINCLKRHIYINL